MIIPLPIFLHLRRPQLYRFYCDQNFNCDEVNCDKISVTKLYLWQIDLRRNVHVTNTIVTIFFGDEMIVTNCLETHLNGPNRIVLYRTVSYRIAFGRALSHPYLDGLYV